MESYPPNVAMDFRREWLNKQLKTLFESLKNTHHHQMISSPEVKNTFKLETSIHLYTWSVTDILDQIKTPFASNGWIVTSSAVEAYPSSNVHKQETDQRVYTITVHLNPKHESAPYR